MNDNPVAEEAKETEKPSLVPSIGSGTQLLFQNRLKYRVHFFDVNGSLA